MNGPAFILQLVMKKEQSDAEPGTFDVKPDALFTKPQLQQQIPSH